MYSAKSHEELLFKSEIEEICEKKSDLFKVDFFLTQEGKTTGRIDENSLQNAIQDGNKDNTFVFICGPTLMIKDIDRLLVRQVGIPAKRIFYELWW